ncbi:MAG: 5'-nucleotidase, partial [Acidobacteria bacterium]|nr:5'-nucleotidase [Acidobacteriota bacterium]
CLTRYEREEWQSDKETRRAEVARVYRVVLLVGDDLNDFISGGRAGVEDRQALFDSTLERWGQEWILLPNPMYGSWEKALTLGTGDLSPQENLELKLQALEAYP